MSSLARSRVDATTRELIASRPRFAALRRLHHIPAEAARGVAAPSLFPSARLFVTANIFIVCLVCLVCLVLMTLSLVITRCRERRRTRHRKRGSSSFAAPRNDRGTDQADCAPAATGRIVRQLLAAPTQQGAATYAVMITARRSLFPDARHNELTAREPGSGASVELASRACGSATAALSPILYRRVNGAAAKR